MDLLQIIDKNSLTPLVRRVQDNPRLEILEWQFTKLGGGSTEAEVYRVSGTARNEDEPVAWSLVLKLLPPPSSNKTGTLAPAEDPTSSNYWKREFLVYSSHLLDSLPNGLSAPRCFLAEERYDYCWLWLEDVDAVSGVEWSIGDFGTAARHLGQFNGVWLVEQELPSFDWLNNKFVHERAFAMDTNEHNLAAAVETLCQHNSMLREVWTDETVLKTQQLLTEREMFLSRLDQLPQTFSHQDTGRKNLSIRSGVGGHVSTVVIDWGFAGLGVAGIDLGPLIVSSARWFGGIAPSQLMEVESLVFEAYLQGLSEAGWNGEVRVVRLGYLISSILLFGPFWVKGFSDFPPETRDKMKVVFGHPYEEVVRRWSEVNQHVLAQADEVRRLI